MAEDKKDLTDLLKFAESLEQSGESAPSSDAPAMEAPPIEQIESFEALEDYAKSHPHGTRTGIPAAENPDAAFSEPPPSEPAAPAEFSLDPTPSLEGGGDVLSQATSEPVAFDLGNAESAPSEIPPPSNGLPLTSETSFQISAGSPAPSFLDSSGEGSADSTSPPIDSGPALDPFGNSTPSSKTPAFGQDAFAATPGFENTSQPLPSTEDFSSAPLSSPSIETSPLPSAPPANSPPPEAKPAKALDKIKAYSEKMTPGKPPTPAAFPFSLLIRGKLRPEEKEKLLEIISRENMGIREIDLEPQFLSGKILIPRISEYAGIVILQALRSARAQIKFGPSDTIFSTADTREDQAAVTTDWEDQAASYSADVAHPAEEIPVTTENQLPNNTSFTLLDTITATAAAKFKSIEGESSAEYQEILEALQRELKYKAFRRKADAVLNFKVQLTPLSTPTHYRLLVTGTAVKITSGGKRPPPPPPPDEIEITRTESPLELD